MIGARTLRRPRFGRSWRLPGALDLAIAVAAVSLIAAPSAASAQLLRVGVGSTLSLGSGSLDLGCADLTVAGGFNVESGSVLSARDIVVASGASLDGGSGAINLTRAWSNAGTFAAGTGSVNVLDGCSAATATITGDNSFNILSVITSSGKKLALQAGSTQTVSSALTLAGASGAGNALLLRSTSHGAEAQLDALGSVSVSYIDVNDIYADASHIQVDGSSKLGDNTLGWSYLASAVPSLSLVAAGVLVLSLVASARRRLGGRA